MDDGFVIGIQVGELIAYVYEPTNQQWPYQPYQNHNTHLAILTATIQYGARQQTMLQVNNSLSGCRQRISTWCSLQNKRIPSAQPNGRKNTYLTSVGVCRDKTIYHHSLHHKLSWTLFLHNPVVVHIGLKLPVIISIQVLCWNLRWVDWLGFSDAVKKPNQTMNSILQKPQNTDSFTKLIIKVAKNNISHDL